jgi:hypothetical protein
MLLFSFFFFFFFFLSYGIFVTLGAEENITTLMVDWKKFGKIILFGMGFQIE